MTLTSNAAICTYVQEYASEYEHLYYTLIVESHKREFIHQTVVVMGGDTVLVTVPCTVAEVVMEFIAFIWLWLWL